MVFPGGTPFGDYKTKAEFVYKSAVELNDKGTYFPLFGICAGFSFLNAFAATAGDNILDHSLKSEQISIPIKFTVNPA